MTEHEKEIDPAGQEVAEEDNKPVITEPIQPWGFYFKPNNLTKIQNRRYGLFGGVTMIYYIIQFMCCIAAVNFYSDNSRLADCVSGSLTVSGEEASLIFDNVILLLGIYHIIEWLRTTILMTTICIGVNFMWVWYITMLNSLFGLAAFIYCHIVYASAAGRSCALNQTTRYQWLMAEIIIFWVSFWLFLFPFFYLRFFKL